MDVKPTSHKDEAIAAMNEAVITLLKTAVLPHGKENRIRFA
jgi:hypothetical protein